MGCACSKPPPQPLADTTLPRVDFTEKFVPAEAAGAFIDGYQDTLMKLMESATSEEAAQVGWKFQPCKSIPSLKVAYGYQEGTQGPLVVTDYVMNGIDPDALYRWLISIEGFRVIDPDTKNHDRPPVDVFTPQWRDRAETTYAVAPPTMLLMHTRTFMILNAFESARRLFISVPILHKDFPKEDEPKKKQIRARNVWASWVVPHKDGARMISFCWFDMGGSFSASMMDSFMRETFMQKYHERLIKAVAAKPELRQAVDGAEKPTTVVASDQHMQVVVNAT